MADSGPYWDLLAKAANCWKPSDPDEYFELRRLLARRRSRDRAEFVRRFAKYYRLHTGGLTEAFKQLYFERLWNFKMPSDEADPYTPLLLEFYEVRRRQGDHALQASFVSKLIAIHDESRPIYDVHVSNFFGMTPPPFGPVMFRVAGFVENLQAVRERYAAWATASRFASIVQPLLERDERLRRCHPARLCDFLVWTVGAKGIARGADCES
jgi:hypothetical protein